MQAQEANNSAAAWQVKFTGHMTISILDRTTQQQILKVDMLKHGTMNAGDDGLLLARTVNDLNLIASLPSVLQGEPFPPMKHPDAGTSQGPWSLSFDDQHRVLEVRQNRRRVAQRKFPLGLQALYAASRDILLRGLPILNDRLASLAS